MTRSLSRKTLAALVAFIALTAAARADYVSGFDPDGDGFLVLRRGPGWDFDSIGELYPNTIVDVLDQDGPWKYIRLEDGTAGWAYGSAISPGLPLNEDDEAAVPGQDRNGMEITVPLPGSPDRQAILDAARAAAQADIGFSVGLRSYTLRMLGNWAYVQGVPTTAEGKAIDWSVTRYADEMRDGFSSDVAMVLMRRQGTAWTVAESIFGPTDVYWYGWRDKYGLPEELFFSEQEGMIPEADWTGPLPSPAPAASESQRPDAAAPSQPVSPPAWQDPAFGFSLALPDDWRMQMSDENGMHMVVALSPRDEAAVVVIALNTGRKLPPDHLLSVVEPMLTQNIITQARSLSKAPETINGLDGILARYAGTYVSDTGPLPATGEAFYTTTETAGLIVLTIVPDFLADRWQPVLAGILGSFRFPDAAAPVPAPASQSTTPPQPGSAGPVAELSVETIEARLPARPDGRPWGLALARDASPENAPRPPDVTARYMGFAPDGEEPFDTDLDVLVLEGSGDRLDALFAEHRAAPGATPLAFSPQGVEIAADGVEIWLRRQDSIVRIASPDRALALSLAQALAP